MNSLLDKYRDGKIQLAVIVTCKILITTIAIASLHAQAPYAKTIIGIAGINF